MKADKTMWAGRALTALTTIQGMERIFSPKATRRA